MVVVVAVVAVVEPFAVAVVVAVISPFVAAVNVGRWFVGSQ